MGHASPGHRTSPAHAVHLSFAPHSPLLGAAPVPGRLRPKGGGMARRYETVYIFDPALEEPAISERLERFHALLTKDAKGAITNVAHWGKRSLAYPIKKKDTGYYVVAQFETAAELLPEYERAVKLEESVVRFLVVVSEGLPAAVRGARRCARPGRRRAWWPCRSARGSSRRGPGREPNGWRWRSRAAPAPCRWRHRGAVCSTC